MEQLTEIRKFLKEKSSGKAKESWRKFVPASEKVHGVYLYKINKIVSKYKSGGFKLVEKLWDSGYLEERILAAKILGKICKQNPELTLEFLSKFANDITDWAVCDTLATQGIKALTDIKQKEIFELSKRFVKSKNAWKRRFGIVLLINFAKNKSLKKEIKGIVKNTESDKEYYVKKAMNWIERELEKN